MNVGLGLASVSPALAPVIGSHAGQMKPLSNTHTHVKMHVTFCIWTFAVPFPHLIERAAQR